ncbi:uncharacterized protein MELLADRAFT_47506 [Melampsora larici-populina 98AG31]|uniref:J domain-containing protein n=1 Tax=Melampsora larici-populina (strain 98AG31 / pathotype 3-4-7) TaxID=747676 RepID=F4RDY6_MELLP|nr:uncharacterized protein MELLADRAFT_47506 [Melampsora larici-populina 98AG31]EGG09531.1 hypothetical protein MELLADRAFT_47506 [Melampsora larici-populina 98AG31]
MLHSDQPWRMVSGCLSLSKPLSSSSIPMPTKTFKRCLCSSSINLRSRTKLRRPGVLDQKHREAFRKLSTSSTWLQVDHYVTLGIERTASPRQIKQKFYELSKEHHPDLNPQNERATDLFKKFAHAYSVLSDPVSRANHDASLHRLRPQAYDPQFDPNVSPTTRSNASRRAQAHYAWNARPQQHRPSPFPSRSANPQFNQEQSERREFEAAMARFARLANRRAQTSHHPSNSHPIFSNFPPNDDRLRPQPTRLEPKPQAARQAFRLALLLSMMCWLGAKCVPT